MNLLEQATPPQKHFKPRCPHCHQALPKRPSIEERFWKRVIVSDNPDECWSWLGHKNDKRGGRGSFFIEGKSLQPSHVSWFIHHGRWPKENLYILHSCDNPVCNNPNHLSEGTQKENVRQALERKRYPHQHATRCKNGHEWTKENIRFRKRTNRPGYNKVCLICKREWEERNKWKGAIPAKCHGCSKDFLIMKKHYKEKTKNGNTRFFCGNSCSAVYTRAELKRKLEC